MGCYLSTKSDVGNFSHQILFPDGPAKAALTPTVTPCSIQSSYLAKVTDNMLKALQRG